MNNNTININNGKVPEVDTVMKEAKSPEQEARTLAKRIKVVESLRAEMLTAVEAWEDALEKGVPAGKFLEISKDMAASYKTAKANYLVIYPEEVAFGGKPAALEAINQGNSNSSKAATVPQQDVPGLKGIYESKPKMVKAQVHTDVKDFIKHFEMAIKVAEIDVQVHYGKYLEWCLGESYEAYLKSKRENLAENAQETWSVVKDWFLEFKDT
ncbi:hypothetical protein [Absidia glauca]|uniref:Uncharacterized protein n=1 Tax=Absidia glauca TaxID=4829 RepID=A0A163JT77_ABSGL|nr:hypothetical protein [Absidia glauca]